MSHHARRMDEVYQAELEMDRLWQATCAQDPDYLAWLDTMQKTRSDETARRADETSRPDTTRSEQEHAMKIGQMMESKYLKKEDVDPPRLVTIAGFEKVNVARDDEAPEIKWVMKFHEVKPLVMNSTNLQLAARALGSDDTDDWIGRKIVAFNDPNVTYGGKLTGGVRLRAPKQPKAGTAPAAETAEEFDDDIPF